MTAVSDETGKKISTETLIYCLILLPVSLGLWQTGVVGSVYAVGSVVLSAVFIFFGIRFRRNPSVENARSTLLASYFFLTTLMILMFLDKV